MQVRAGRGEAERSEGAVGKAIGDGAGGQEEGPDPEASRGRTVKGHDPICGPGKGAAPVIQQIAAA